jgi:class 3 adenylate cyclase/tetratricopeptide (TPR) repeat protein
MTFDEMLAQVLELLQREKRVSYRALKRRFDLDDNDLEDVKDELIYAKKLAVDEENRVLVWTGRADVPPLTIPPAPPSAPADVQPTPDRTPSTASQSVDAERRQLTVLFCDLVDSTRLASQLDPEDLREVVRAYQATCAEVIQQFEGHIAQYLGDGLLVYFGYPQAHEDDAQGAVRAGLGMVEAMKTLNTRLEREQGFRLAVRIGIHTGLVVVGAMGGQGRQEQLALGETPNVAARLQGLAAPDTVVVSATTVQLIHGYFVYQPLGAQALRGLDQPLQVYRVLQASGAQTRLDVAATRGLTRLVGREQEVGLLVDRWQRTTEGMGHVVVLTGEAGIGKSRLVRVLRDQIGNTAATHIECRCSPHTQHSALYPVIAHLERALAFSRNDSPADRLHKLEDALVSYAVPLTDLVPLLAGLLSLPPPAHYPPLTLTPQRQRQKTLEALLTWLMQETERQPVLFVMEDLHWVDPSTLEWLSLLVAQSPTARIMVLMTCRPEFTPPWPNRAHVMPLTLTRLPRPHVERIVASVAGAKALPRDVVQQIVAKTDGVPLFVEELTKTVLESGLLREHEDHYELTGPLPALAIPATLQDSLMARLDRLSTVKTVAQLGATLGRQFAYDLLQAIAALDEATLQQSLRQLVEAELLYQRGMPPQATYMFKHALIQDAAYQSLLRSARQQHHQHIAEVLEARFPETVETQPEVVAQHYTAAGLHVQALPYWQQAGQRALERSAYREAVASLEQGLEAVTRLPQTRATLEQAVDLRLALRTALQASGDLGRILTCLREAEALAQTLGDDPRRLGRVSHFLSNHLYHIGAYDQAIATGQRTLALATVSGDVALHVLANNNLGRAYHSQGNYGRAIACFGQTVASLDGARRRERFGQIFLPAVGSRGWLAVCHAELGTFAAGQALGDEGLQMAEALAHPASIMLASKGIGLLALRQGDLPRALPLLERAMGICQDADLLFWCPWVAAVLGAAYTLGGRVTDAVPLLTQALEQAIATEMVGDQVCCSLSLGEAQLLAGHPEEAHALAERALELTRTHQERGHEVYALRLLGAIAAQREPPASGQTEDYYRQALALAEELGMRPLLAHCRRGLGTLYATTGQHEQARTELSAAIEMYRAMDMTFWLPETEAALAQVEGR